MGHHVHVSVLWLMKSVFVVCSSFHVDPAHFHLLLLEKYKLVTHARARVIGNKDLVL